MKKTEQDDHFIVAFFRQNLTPIVVGVVSAAVTMALLSFRVDTNSVRISALEDKKADYSIVLEKFDAVNHRLDGLAVMVTANNGKLDRLIERLLK